MHFRYRCSSLNTYLSDSRDRKTRLDMYMWIPPSVAKIRNFRHFRKHPGVARNSLELKMNQFNRVNYACNKSLVMFFVCL